MKLKLFALLLLIPLFASPAYAAKPTPTTPPAPTSKIVCLDPGHGGTDSGAVNLNYTEKELNLQTALALEAKLEATGKYVVELTRRDDSARSNADRYSYCNGINASILISIHHNGSTDSSIDYTTALYMKKADEKLAQIVSNSISNALFGVNPKPISRFASGVLLKANMPATISEGYFVTASNELDAMTNGRIDQETNALLNAVQAYFN